MSKSINRRVVSALLAALVLSTASAVFAKGPKEKENKGRGREKDHKEINLSVGKASDAKITGALNFSTYLSSGFPEQDVFVPASSTPTSTPQVVRVTVADKDSWLNQTLYASTSSTPHDPYQLGAQPLGPFPQGSALKVTLRQWLAANGRGTYTLVGDSAKLSLNFGQLVPNGTYALLCGQVTRSPYQEVLAPCGAADGSQNTIATDLWGNAKFDLTLPPLPTSTASTTTVIMAAYHSDGQSSGAAVGEFGKNTHVQLLTPLPALAARGRAPVDLACMQQAVLRRDDAIITAFDTYHANVKRALEQRRTALANAWGITDRKLRRAATKQAWKEYRETWRKESRQFQKAKKAAWKQYYADRKACGQAGASDDHGTEGDDAQL